MAESLCAQGKSLLEAHQNLEARDMYSSATTRDRWNARAWNGVGVADDLLGKRDEAAVAYKRALELNPNDLSALNNLAHLDLEIGNPQEAVHLLQPHATDPNAPLSLKENLTAALKASTLKETAESDVYADLGSYPTEGMAQGHFKEIRALLDDKAITLAIAPEVKVGGGTPTFTIKATGRSPQEICDEISAKAYPCIPQGK